MSTVTILKQYVASVTSPYLMQCLTTKTITAHTIRRRVPFAILQQANHIILVQDFNPYHARSQQALQQFFPVALNNAKNRHFGYKHLSNQAA